VLRRTLLMRRFIIARSDAAVFFNDFCYIKTTKDAKVSLTAQCVCSLHPLTLNPGTV
jgi:hypothetical protein